MQWIRIVGLAMILVVLISIAGALAQISPAKTVTTAKSFEECVAAGGPVIPARQSLGAGGESYPRQCKGIDGTMFVEKVIEQPRQPVSTAPRCVPAGCSAQICTEESEASNIVTTCEYKAEYGCYKSAKCERQVTGHCGWTETPALNKCLKNPPSVSQSAAIELVN